MTRTHIPKKHEQLMNSQDINLNAQKEDTKYRILGHNNFDRQRPENYQYAFCLSCYSYGKGQNKAETFAKTGRKQQLV